jgi:hypothetical protein
VRDSLLLSFLCLSILPAGSQTPATHTEAAMQCADTSKRDSGDVVVTNTCAFNIVVAASTPERTYSLGNLDPGGSRSIPTSTHNEWRVFSCRWPGTPADPAVGKDVTYNTVKYECDVQSPSPQPEQSPS